LALQNGSHSTEHARANFRQPQDALRPPEDVLLLELLPHSRLLPIGRRQLLPGVLPGTDAMTFENIFAAKIGVFYYYYIHLCRKNYLIIGFQEETIFLLKMAENHSVHRNPESAVEFSTNVE
jgi:hypothetical protein